MQDDSQYLVALSKIGAVGAGRARNLIAYCGGVKEVFSASKAKLLKIPQMTEIAVDNLLNSDYLAMAELEMEKCEKNGIELIDFRSKEYPSNLKTIFKSPLVLYKKGKLDLNSVPAVAVVGTRLPTSNGRIYTQEFAGHLASMGLNVVSGLAFGIDTEAHKAALQNDGITTAVLGHGLANIYPAENTNLSEKICQSGALLTEYGFEGKIHPGNFPARNRIISGMSLAVLVVEAKEKGGALITGKFGFEQNREVYAIPGDINTEESRGCNNLIRDSIAKLVTDPKEILADLDITEKIKRTGKQLQMFAELPAELDVIELKVLETLEAGEMVIDKLSELTTIPGGSLLSVLLGLEFKGLIRQFPGRKFRRL